MKFFESLNSFKSKVKDILIKIITIGINNSYYLCE
jgi:hypothetical protein